MVGLFVRKFQGAAGTGPSVMALALIFFFTIGVCGASFNCTHGKYYPNPDTCSKFYHCVWGTPVSMDCPAPLVFNTDTNVCDWKHNVTCKDGIRPCVGLHQFQCDDGKCIPYASRCDDVDDCSGSEDEKNCVCTPGRIPCENGVDCIREDYWCDTFRDCPDGSDEKNCPAGCTGYHKFECDGNCFYIAQQCDDYKDCSDGSDEDPTLCNGCQGGYFQCGDGNCIEEYRLCDTVSDCANGKDELPESCHNFIR